MNEKLLSMNTIDIIILILLVPALYKGITQGFIRQATGIIGLVLGIFLAREFADLLAGYLHEWIQADASIVKIIAFVLIMIGVLFCLNLLGKLVEKVFQIVMMGWLNRLLGVVLAVGGTCIILSLLASLIVYTNENWFILIQPEVIKDSKLFGTLIDISEHVLPFLNFKK